MFLCHRLLIWQILTESRYREPLVAFSKPLKTKKTYTETGLIESPHQWFTETRQYF
jgi:hypothetical protein